MKGKIIFVSVKGYGYVRKSDGWGDLVFYQSDILNQEWLREDQEVEFEVVAGENGRDKAIWLRKIIF